MRPLYTLIPVACLLAVVVPATAQLPTVQEIDLYGLRKVPAESILKAGKLRSGQPLPPSKGDLEEAIEKVPGVLRARVEVKCCEDGAILFVGIEERGGPHVEFHSEPSGNATPPAGMMEAYQKFLDALRQTGSQGGRDPALSKSEDQFVTLASENLPQVRDALYNGAEPDERAAAAIVIGYASKKNEIMPDLEYALRDPDESVRSNAIRSLHASVVTEDGGTQGILVPIGALVDLLESVVLSDRLEAADLLVTLTNDRSREPLTLMRTRALHSLVEMARWESLRYAIRPYILVGRIAGFSEDDIIKWWSSGQREHVIQKALALPPVAPAGNKATPRKQASKQ
jgi:hypothetical protein